MMVSGPYLRILLRSNLAVREPKPVLIRECLLSAQWNDLIIDKKLVGLQHREWCIFYHSHRYPVRTGKTGVA
jgi:hypothetical protein